MQIEVSKVVGVFAGDVGVCAGEVGVYTGDVGVYTGDIGVYTGDVGVGTVGGICTSSDSLITLVSFLFF